ncbi:MAG: exodeoxyribonuclease V subunit gamma [Wenzhouxiangellaceae bacterium]|nr:exodeoxyribonuclease V subunit gamma [Wenzhouxiangellaceae bacterium]
MIAHAALNDDVSAGLAILHANRSEDLRQLFLAHVARRPLQPLEDEVVLVQSVGIGRWLQLGMAENPGADAMDGGLGIGASVRFELPARFLWNAYRIVLGADRLPAESLFDPDRLQWLVFRELVAAAQRPGFEPLARYLAVDGGDSYRRFQLAGEIARLFDTYQFFRGDWLLDWEAGRDVLRLEDQRTVAVPDEQRWQPGLWRALTEAAGPAGGQHRGRLHNEFVTALERPEAAFPALPRRISLFGITALPAQSLRALAALSRHLQVLVFVHNPCRYYWGNIIEAREVQPRWGARHRSRPGMPQQPLEAAELANWANPLLASWGKQGRDFIGLLDRMDRPDDYMSWFDDRIDLFEDHAAVTVGQAVAPLLHQLQQSILDLTPAPAPEDRPGIPAADASIRFVAAHGRQREVEILHDTLLGLFKGEHGPQPREVVVMVPSIDDYAPHIAAVFGQYAGLDGQRSDDARYIPYAIADRKGQADSSFLRTLSALLELPHWRVTADQVFDLLQAPAMRARFGIESSDLVVIERWLAGAGVRWGINRKHRGVLLESEQAFNQNSWAFGLDRMMLGYACGRAEAWLDTIAYDEITAGQAPLVAALRRLLSRLEYWQSALAQPATPERWDERIRRLAEDFMLVKESDDTLDRYRLERALEALAEALAQAGVTEPLTREVAAEALAARLEPEGPGSRFLAGRVTFCTLVPMRAIPFRVVCLLGMNDGEYPRSHRAPDFDLIGDFPRPGDRSRRDDDRYLFLQALLSARETLYVSWVGRSLRDNSSIPPSVLVGQLRDAIAQGWALDPPAADEQSTPADAGQRLVDHLTTVHPLQPFSREYFRPAQQRLRSHSREWAAVWQSSTDPGPATHSAAPLALSWPTEAIGLHTLSTFFKKPVDCLLRDTLQIRLASDVDIGGLPIDEPMVLDSLEKWQLGDELLQQLLDASDEPEQPRLDRYIQQLAREGRLPVGLRGQEIAAELIEEAHAIGERYFVACETFNQPVEKQRIELDFEIEIDGQVGSISIHDWLPDMRGNSAGDRARIHPMASKVGGPRSPAWDKLAAHWPQHLAACAADLPLETLLIGKDQNRALPPLAPEQARALLQDLVTCGLIGRTRPLPIDPKTSGEYLKHKGAADALDRAAKVYEGDGYNAGVIARDAALARIYPDFQSLLGDHADGFRGWSERVYGPMVRCVLKRGVDA